jgi:hypothetical protein
MDDSAASQQLLDEAARAGHATRDYVGRSETMADGNIRGTPEMHQIQSTPPRPVSGLASGQQAVPSPLQPSSLDSLHSFFSDDEVLQDRLASSPRPPADSISRPSHDVEVPDSQFVPAPSETNDIPQPSPVPTSSLIIPASMHAGQSHTEGKKRARSAKSIKKSAPKSDDIPNIPKDTASSATETPTETMSQKERRRKKSYVTPPSTMMGSEETHAASEQDTHAVQLAAHAAEGLVTATKRSRKKASLIHGGTDRRAPLAAAADDDRSPRAAGKLRRIKKSKPLLSTDHMTSSGDNLHSGNPATDVDNTSNASASQAPDGTGSAGAKRPRVVEPTRTSTLRKRKSNRKESHLEVQDLQASDHNGDQASQHAAPDATFIVQDEPPHVPPTDDEPPSTRRKRTKRSKPSQTNKPRRRYTRKSNVDTSMTAAERALSTHHILEYPLELPASGKFTQDEDEILRRAIMDFQQRRSLDVENLVAIIQWTDPSRDSTHPRKRADWDPSELEEEEESIEFWEEIKNTEPKLNRTLEIIKRHIQARYSSFKSGAWTEEEDDELKQLMEQYPNQWKILSIHMGNRSAIDIHNRWKDYVQHGNNRNTSRWTFVEEQSLLNALTVVIQEDEDNRTAARLPPLAEYSNKDVKWSKVCELMGNVRSRLQCTVKWTQMKARDASANIHPVYKQRRARSLDQSVESNDDVALVDDDGAVALMKKLRKAREREAHQEPGHDEATASSEIHQHPRISSNIEADAAPQHNEQNNVFVTPSHEHVTDGSQLRTAGVKQMRGGDKADLVDALTVSQDIMSEEDIDWPQIAATMKNTWSIEVLQAALKELLEHVNDQGNFVDTMMEVQYSLLEKVDHQELRTHYNPSDTNVIRQGESSSTRVVEQKSRQAKVMTQPNTKRKRKSEGDDTSGLRSTASRKKKKKKLSSLPPTRKEWKSSAVITESDDAAAADNE